MNKYSFSRRDYKTLCQIFRMKEKTLKKSMEHILRKFYPEDSCVFTKDYLYAFGDIPIGLVAHLDTIHLSLPKEIFHDQEQGVIWSPEGLGADDRAGIYAIIRILQEGYRPTVILTTQEEKGGIGAVKLVQDITKPISPISFLIELDRKGEDEMVFYDCGNQEFEKYIENFGFSMNLGTFSDISIIAPSWEVAAVNLSIGYEDEHSRNERLYYHHMLATIEKVGKILDAETVQAHPFEFILEKPIFHSFFSNGYMCDACGSPIPEKELKLVHDSGAHWILCEKCINNLTKVCKKCGSRYIVWYNMIDDGLCQSCRDKNLE